MLHSWQWVGGHVYQEVIMPSSIVQQRNGRLVYWVLPLPIAAVLGKATALLCVCVCVLHTPTQ